MKRTRPHKKFPTAAWTLPKKITDWCGFLTTLLDRRSRKSFLPLMAEMVLVSGRRTVFNWLRAAGVSDDWQDFNDFL